MNHILSFLQSRQNWFTRFEYFSLQAEIEKQMFSVAFILATIDNAMVDCVKGFHPVSI